MVLVLTLVIVIVNTDLTIDSKTTTESNEDQALLPQKKCRRLFPLPGHKAGPEVGHVEGDALQHAFAGLAALLLQF